jgi:hypothetical protein
VQPCYSGKAIIITYYECVFVALFIQHVMRLRRIILLCVVRATVQYFSTLSHKRHDFRNKLWNKNVFWFSVQLLSETFPSLRRNE